MDHWNCPVPSQVTWENNQSPLNEMHIHQQNHWNDTLFYWYQRTISLTNSIRLCILDMCAMPTQQVQPTLQERATAAANLHGLNGSDSRQYGNQMSSYVHPGDLNYQNSWFS